MMTKEQKSAARQVKYDASIEAERLEAKALKTADALAQTPHIEIITAIGKIDTRLSVMEFKQDDLIKKVAIQNGRVADSEAAIKKILKSDTYEDGKKAGMKTIWISFIAVISFTIGSIIVPMVTAWIQAKL
jgi:hypothetical protein